MSKLGRDSVKIAQVVVYWTEETLPGALPLKKYRTQVEREPGKQLGEPRLLSGTVTDTGVVE